MDVGSTFDKEMNLEMIYLNPDMNLVMTLENGNESRNEFFLRRIEPGDNI